MWQNGDSLQDAALTQLMRLNAAVSGLVTGIMVGLAVFVATNWLVLKGGDVVGPHLSLLGQFFVGYEVTFLGSLIGFGYGLVGGFLVGYSVAKLYNWFVRIGVLGLAGLLRLFDIHVIDRAVNGVATLTRNAGLVLRQLQTGQLDNYAWAMYAGVVVIAVATLVGQFVR